MRKTTAMVLALAGAAALGAAPARAEEVKTLIRPTLLFDLAAPRTEQRAVAYDEALRQPGPATRSTDGEVLPDGTVRYGNVSVTVRNPCPPGTAHYDPPPLPGRRDRK